MDYVGSYCGFFPVVACILTQLHMKIITWIKRLGFVGFLFFLVKGLLWLLVPALIAFWAS